MIEAYGFVFSGDDLVEHLGDLVSPASPPRSISVSFEAVEVPATPERWVSAQPHGLRVGWGGFVDYEFTGVGPSAVTARSAVEDPRHALLGLFVAALPLSLPRWGIEPLHGSVVARNGLAVAALGHSGHGKSTFAATMRRRGWEMVADDVLALSSTGGVLTGPPFLGSYDTPETESIGVYDGKPLRLLTNQPRQPRLAQVVVLEPVESGPLELAPLTGGGRAARLLTYVRAPWALPELRRRSQLELLAQLADVPVSALRHVRGRDEPEAVADLVEGALSGV